MTPKPLHRWASRYEGLPTDECGLEKRARGHVGPPNLTLSLRRRHCAHRWCNWWGRSTGFRRNEMRGPKKATLDGPLFESAALKPVSSGLFPNACHEPAKSVTG